jgi:hypothetical protein
VTHLALVSERLGKRLNERLGPAILGIQGGPDGEAAVGRADKHNGASLVVLHLLQHEPGHLDGGHDVHVDHALNTLGIRRKPGVAELIKVESSRVRHPHVVDKHSNVVERLAEALGDGLVQLRGVFPGKVGNHNLD